MTGAVGDVVFRPMRLDDVAAAERLTAVGYHELDVRLTPRVQPVPELRSAARAAEWVARTRHLVGTDPGGCWVAEDAEGLVGIAVSFDRELMWCLASYAVRPGRQGQGIGRALLAPALHHGRGSLRGMLASSADPRAVRRYRQAGFHLHPAMHLSGRVDRSALPVVEKVREGSASDVELMDSVDRLTRGAAHGPDHELMLRLWRLVVSDTTTGSGYAYLDADSRVLLLAATNRRTAGRLLWEALASATGPTVVGHVSAANEWAVDIGLAARLDLHASGFLGVRHLAPPTPYLYHGTLL